jgi:glycosyltransferase involved in cell wall biosynthesis
MPESGSQQLFVEIRAPSARQRLDPPLSALERCYTVARMSGTSENRTQALRLFFLIRSLNLGGAERQLVELVGELSARGYPITVCAFYDGGALKGQLEALPDVAVVSLSKRGRWDIAGFLWRLTRVVRDVRPDLIHGYMPVANEFALAMSKLSSSGCVFGLRASSLDFSTYGYAARAVFLLDALCSHFADATIVNSEAGKRDHIGSGYDAKRMSVVHNGIDCERFCPDPAAGAAQRLEWGISPHERLVGIVARLDPMKDHRTFIEAAARVAKLATNVRFVSIGQGPPSYAEELRSLAATLGVDILWAGARSDMRAVYNALDLVVLSSAFGEGFPNVVGEAMATGTRCVVTDVGDAGLVVGDTGRVVPPGNPAALAAEICDLLRQSAVAARAAAAAARDRIIGRFSKRALADATEKVLLEVARERHIRPRTRAG